MLSFGFRAGRDLLQLLIAQTVEVQVVGESWTLMALSNWRLRHLQDSQGAPSVVYDSGFETVACYHNGSLQPYVCNHSSRLTSGLKGRGTERTR